MKFHEKAILKRKLKIFYVNNFCGILGNVNGTEQSKSKTFLVDHQTVKLEFCRGFLPPKPRISSQGVSFLHCVNKKRQLLPVFGFLKTNGGHKRVQWLSIEIKSSKSLILKFFVGRRVLRALVKAKKVKWISEVWQRRIFWILFNFLEIKKFPEFKSW